VDASLAGKVPARESPERGQPALNYFFAVLLLRSVASRARARGPYTSSSDSKRGFGSRRYGRRLRGYEPGSILAISSSLARAYALGLRQPMTGPAARGRE
jgi:hypothetical protein